MPDDPDVMTCELIDRAVSGDKAALALVYGQFRERLRQMVRLRLDQRLQGRVDPSDVIQDAFVDVTQKIGDFKNRGDLPFLLWLRLVVGERLLRIHRQHLGAAMRDAGREVSIHGPSLLQASSASLAAQLLGRITSASRAAARSEMQRLLQDALNGMDAIDREVIALRHFEELSNDEVALVLEISKAAASKRYVRAMLRLKDIIGQTPGLAEPPDAKA